MTVISKLSEVLGGLFSINSQTGTVTLRFRSGSLVWNPSALRTITIPDTTGTLALRDVAQQFTATQGVQPVVANASGVVSSNLSQSNFFIYTLTGNITNFTATNLVAGRTYIFYLNQDGTGGRTVALDPVVFPAPNNSVLSVSPSPNSRNVLACSCDGTALHCGIEAWG